MKETTGLPEVPQDARRGEAANPMSLSLYEGPPLGVAIHVDGVNGSGAATGESRRATGAIR